MYPSPSSLDIIVLTFVEFNFLCWTTDMFLCFELHFMFLNFYAMVFIHALLPAWQLCPLYPHNPEVLLNELKSPSDLLDFGEFSDCMDFGSGAGSHLLHVVNPAFDYVPPKLVNLFITDT